MRTQPTAVISHHGNGLQILCESDGMTKSLPISAIVRAAILCACAVSAGTPAFVRAETVGPSYRFDIANQNLSQALRSYGQIAGQEIIFTEDLVAGVRPATLKGEYTAEAALDRLLSGTGLVAERSPSRAVMIKRSGAMKKTSYSMAGAAGFRLARVDNLDGHDIPEARGSAVSYPQRRGFFGRTRLAQADSPASSTNNSDQSSTSGPARLEEVIVTAQKRSERLLDVPISISAYTPEAMDRRGLRDLADIAAVTPGLYFRNDGVFTNIGIRGIASTSGTGTTAVYIDDIPIQIRAVQPTFSTLTPKIFDLERVEVLRGPQGTLFGASAQGGAIRFITPQPSLTDYDAYARSEVASTDGGAMSHEAGIAVGGPIVEDRIGFRLSGWYRRDGGYVDHDSYIPGGVQERDSNGADSYVARAAVTFAPNDALSITPSVYAQKVETDDLSGFDLSRSEPDDGRFVNTDLLMTPGSDSIVVPSIRAELDLGPVALTSISTYLDRKYVQHIDYTRVLTLAFGGPIADSSETYMDDVHRTDQNNFAQEVRLSSTDENAAFKWTVGAYYAEAKQKGSQYIEAPGFPAWVLAKYGRTIEEQFGMGLVDGRLIVDSVARYPERQMAGFVNTEYTVAPGLSLSAGVRVSKERVDFRIDRNGPIFGGSDTTRGSQEETSVTPKFSINYKPSENSLIYASAAKGYRGGGPNSIAVLSDACGAQLDEVGSILGSDQSYGSDTLWSYEIGTKNAFADGRLNVEGSVFYVEWTDIQQNIGLPACLINVIANVGEATSQGFEMNVDSQVTDNLLASLSVGYTSAEFSSETTIFGSTYIRDGDQVFDTAPWNVSASLQYEYDVSALARGYVRVENRYRSKNAGSFSAQNPANRTYNSFFNPAEDRNDLNLRLGVMWDKFDVSLFANNVLNEHPFVIRNENPAAAPSGSFTVRPRTIGITGTYRW